MTETHLNEPLATALQAAKSARKVILSYYNGDFDIEIKANQAPNLETRAVLAATPALHAALSTALKPE